jgi:hypothetical protein
MSEELKKYIEEYCESLVGVKLLLAEDGSTKLYKPIYINFSPEEKLRVMQKVREYLVETIQLGFTPIRVNIYCVIIKAYDPKACGDFINSIPLFEFKH